MLVLGAYWSNTTSQHVSQTSGRFLPAARQSSVGPWSKSWAYLRNLREYMELIVIALKFNKDHIGKLWVSWCQL